MKIVVIGDIHGRFVWRNIIDKEVADIFVFLGDYVSDEKTSGNWQIANLESILNFKEDNPEKVILLRGNHDMQHLGYSWADCSGLNSYVLEEMSRMKNRFESDTQWIYTIDNVIFSHAGITKTWLLSIGLTESNINEINKINPNASFGFIPDSPCDTIGTSKTQGVTWVRPNALIMDSIKNVTQIVGHTPVKEVCKKMNTENNCCFWFCDSLPQYLVIENRHYYIKQSKIF